MELNDDKELIATMPSPTEEKEEDFYEKYQKHNSCSHILILIGLFLVLGCLVYIGYRQIEIENAMWDLKYGDELLVELRDNGMITYRDIKGTGSMRPMIDKRMYPNLKTTNKNITGEDIKEWDIRRIYVYEKRNETENETQLVMHRLVGIYNISNVSYYIFKGDNNDVVDDYVFREQIVEEVIGVKYR